MKRVIGVFIVFLIAVAVITYINYDFVRKKQLKVYSPCDVNPELYDNILYRKCLGHKITNFNLTDQLNRRVTLKNIQGKIVVADFFFVSCPGICLKMTKNLEQIHEKVKTDTNIIILSHTVWPEVDSAEVLFTYAEAHNANHENWRFLTGDKKELYRLARKNYLVAPDINDENFDHGSEADFIHTENVVLVDKKQRIRGFYDGTDPAAMSMLLSDIKILLND